MLEGSAEPAAGVVFSPRCPEEVQSAVRTVSRFVAFNCELFRLPAFRIFGDRALQSIATTAPRNEAELLAVQGIGAGIVKKYGAQIFRLVAASR
jgi:superfamily II DNA helicase RecQ